MTHSDPTATPSEVQGLHRIFALWKNRISTARVSRGGFRYSNAGICAARRLNGAVVTLQKTKSTGFSSAGGTRRAAVCRRRTSYAGYNWKVGMEAFGSMNGGPPLLFTHNTATRLVCEEDRPTN